MPELRPGTTRHEQISTWLRTRIEDGTYEPGDRLPSESALGTQFSVSRITVRRALQTLEADGLIVRRQGRGSFVNAPRVRQGLVRLTDFAEDMEQAGLRPSSQVLSFKPERASPFVAARLGLDDGAAVCRLDRLRLGNGEPIALDRTWLPPSYAHLLDGHDLEQGTIYQILEAHHDVPILRGRYRIEAVDAPADVAELLGVPRRRALLRIERVSFTTGDQRVYYQRRYYRSDRVAYDLTLERSPDEASPRRGMPLQGFGPIFKDRGGQGGP